LFGDLKDQFTACPGKLQLNFRTRSQRQDVDNETAV
jgi:hypothetical protein